MLTLKEVITVGPTFCLLTAALLVSQGPESMVVTQQTTVQRSSCSYQFNGRSWQKTWTTYEYTTTPQERSGWWSRFMERFSSNPSTQQMRIQSVPQQQISPLTMPVNSAEPPLNDSPSKQQPSKEQPIQVQILTPTS